jgi:two-component system LytT family sensor kinase
MGSTLKRRLRAWGKYFLIWTALGVFFFSQGVAQKFFSRDPTPWWHYLASWLTGVYLWALLTPGVLWLGRRFPIERTNWRRRTVLHLVFSVGVALVQITSESAVLPLLGVFPAVMKTFGFTLAFLLVLGFHQAIMGYWTVLGIQYGWRYYRRYQEREKQALRLELHTSELKAQLMRAQLSALKMQLQPHFLFNTLNAIMVLVRQRKEREAEETLALLSDLLRCVLEDVEAQEVPLRRELEYLQLYLSIEQVRFQDRLRIEISADPSVLDAAVPHMGLQPIVENAIRHGIGRSSAAGRIQIGASRVGETLEIRVQDDGPGLPAADSAQGRGIGLANTRARLQQLYGDGAHLAVENGGQGGTVATMVLPYHLAAVASETEVMELNASHDADR